MLNLQHIHRGETNLAGFAKKSDANAFAKAHGWKASNVIQAYNRFQIFWVIGQSLPGDTYSLATKDGKTIEVNAQNDWRQRQAA